MLFEIAAGAPRSPVILHVPHASRELTGPARAGIRLDDAALADELDHLTDAHTDQLARQAARGAAVPPWIFINRWSRLVVDPERLPDEREEMRAVGMGAVYTHGYAGRKLRDEDPVRDGTALRTHFRPYAAAVSKLVADRLRARGRAVILDLHSYSTRPLPYELHATGPRPPVCLGTDPFHTPPALAAAARAAFGEVAPDVPPGPGVDFDGVAFDTPFAGCYVPLDFYRTEPAVTALMIELRRDGYMREPGGPPTGGLSRLAARLTALIDAVT